MAKTNASFRLSKTTKRMLALGRWKNVEQMHGWKRAMIDAEYTASIVPKTSKRERTGGNYNTTSNSATPAGE